MSRKPPVPRALQEPLILLGLLLASLVWLPGKAAYREIPLGIDDLGWLAVSHDTYRLFFRAEDPPPEAWREGLQATTYGRLNPNLGKLIYGNRLAGRGYDLEAPRVFPAIHPEAAGRFGNPAWLETRAAEHKPYLAELRDLNRWFVALAAIGLYVLGRMWRGRVLGFLGWGWFLSTPLVREQTLRVGTDPALLLFVVFSTLVMAWWLQHSSRTRAPAWLQTVALMLLGCLLGAAASVKLNGALQAFVYAGALLPLWFAGRFRPAPAWWISPALLVPAAVSLAFFYGLHPVLHGDPLGEIRRILADWDALLQSQAGRFPGLALDSLGAKAGAVWKRGIAGTGPFGPGSPYANAPLFVAGLVLAVVHGLRALRGRAATTVPWTLLVWSLVWIVATVLWIPIDWERYSLPVVAVSSLLLPLPLDELFRRAVGWQRGLGS